MMPRQERGMVALLEKMSISDLTQAMQLLSKELDRRSGKAKTPHYTPKWPPDLTTR